jgi:hypothetical protein
MIKGFSPKNFTKKIGKFLNKIRRLSPLWELLPVQSLVLMGVYWVLAGMNMLLDLGSSLERIFEFPTHMLYVIGLFFVMIFIASFTRDLTT